MSAGKPHPDSQQPWLSRRRFWTLIATGIGLMLLVAAAGIYYGYVTDVPLVISRETTYITEPLAADGTRVDYFAAAESMCYPPEMATEENGFRMVVEALGPSSEYSRDQQLEIYEKLGLDPNTPPTMAYEDPYDVLNRYAKDMEATSSLPEDMDVTTYRRELERQLGQPWSLDNLPMMEDWLTANGETLDLMAAAVRKPVFVVPWARSQEQPPLMTIQLEDIQLMRSYARGYQARAGTRTMAGDIDGAIDDIVACARLGRHLQRGGFIIEVLVGIACEAMAFGIGPGSGLSHQPSVEQWEYLLNELDRLPERPAPSLSLEIERLSVLDAIQSIALGDETADSDLLEGRSYGVDWNVAMSHANETFGEILSSGRDDRPDPPDRSWLSRVISRRARSLMIGDVMAWFLCPPLDQYLEARRRSVCKENLMRIAIAMLLYEKEYGTLPPAYSVDEQGNPLHSWRVLILPYLGYDELHSQIRLDEPWDSEHNSQFHTADVPIYQCPSGVHSAGMTIYTVVEGDTTAFNGGEGKQLDAFGPNSANLILVSERLDPVGWMDPTREVPFAIAERGINVDGATSGLGSEHEGGLHTALRSGAVKFFSENISDEDLRGLLEGNIEHAP